jgi:predicted house-cleaning noncanonical NTP pyrophosphatase (MazG superfamily)
MPRKTIDIALKEPFEYKGKHYNSITLHSFRTKDLKNIPSEMWDKWEVQTQVSESAKEELSKELKEQGVQLEPAEFKERLDKKIIEEIEETMQPSESIKLAVAIIPLIASMSNQPLSVIEEMGVPDLMLIASKITPFLAQSLAEIGNL